jgi:hypothetical protein
VLSTTTQPACPARTAWTLDTLAPAENRPMCALLKSNVSTSSTGTSLPLKRTVLPTDLALASG